LAHVAPGLYNRRLAIYQRSDAIVEYATMFLHVLEAKYLHDHVIWPRFNDGAVGEVNLHDELSGEVFEPLRDLANFKRFRVDPELQTIVWEKGADLAPEFLYTQMKVPA
jgi:hypothetical protein